VDASAARSLQEDLRQSFTGTIHLDGVSRQLYSTDASLFQLEPVAVAVPRDEGDVSRIVRYCYDHTLPITPRGAGTGLAGESLNVGVALDLSVHFRAIIECGSDFARVQPGVTLRQLNLELAKSGRRFAPDPASGATCTLGGMAANDASGGKAAIHGTTRNHIRALRVVWDDGTVDALSSDALTASGNTGEPRTLDIAGQIDPLLKSSLELVAARRSPLRFDRAGYAIAQAMAAEGSKLLPLVIGSEGTLGVITELTLNTIPLPGGRAGALFGFDSFEKAIEAARIVRELHPAACELMDRWLISLVRTQSPDAARTVPAECEAVMMVEFERDAPAEARDTATRAIEAVHLLSLMYVPAMDGPSCDFIWSLRSATLPSLYALGKGSRPLAFIEDLGLPPDEIAPFVAASQRALREFDVRASYLIHAATGQIHIRPFLDTSDADDAGKLYAIADRIHSLAIDAGGTISAQHATGIARTPWLEKQFGRLFPVFREVKRIFDPKGIFNPSKIVGLDPTRPAWTLRKPVPSDGAQENTAKDGTPRVPLLVWQPLEMERAVEACNGCGACRTESFNSRMCPMFRADHREAASPRAKANLLREILTTPNAEIAAHAIHQVAELCVNCKMCALECPGKADIPKLMLEAKAAHHAAHGLSRSDWFLARIDGLSAIGSIFSLTNNILLRRKSVRYLLEKVFGVSRKRTLPTFAYRRYTKRIGRALTRRPELKPGETGVCYFVDTFANSFDTGIAEATVAVLKHNGIVVHVPPRQRGSGAPALAHGDSDVAIERLKANVRILAESVRAGYTVVCSEPTAALFFRLDALGLSTDPDVKLVSDNVVELMAFLAGRLERGELKTDFQTLDLSVGHHVPCHIKALGQGSHSPEILSLIPGLRPNVIDVGCSGMAGVYGLKAKNYEQSLAIGRPMLTEFARPKHFAGSSECATCRMQMTEGTGKPSLHPVQYLAMAYGLMPELAGRLKWNRFQQKE
jgi:FAD/FMN-containing dehydrogenase/Fe-S oxidoreductase